MYSLNFETEICFVRYLQDNIVEVETKEGIEVTEQNANEVYRLIEQSLIGDYKILIHRKNSYSVTPGAYQAMNQRPQLQKIAIVVKTPVAEKVAMLEQSWCKKPLQIFATAMEAFHWLATEELPVTTPVELQVS